MHGKASQPPIFPEENDFTSNSSDFSKNRGEQLVCWALLVNGNQFSRKIMQSVVPLPQERYHTASMIES